MNTMPAINKETLQLCETEHLLANDVNLRALFAQFERMDGLLQHHLYQLRGRKNDKHNMQSFLMSQDVYEQRISEARGMPHWASAMSEPPIKPFHFGTIPVNPNSRLDQLIARFGLTPFEVDLLVLCLLPQCEHRYGLLFEYLQDASPKDNVTVAFALALLCTGVPDRLRQEASLSPQSTLLRHGLMTLKRKSGCSDTLQVDSTLYRYLIGQDVLPECLGSCVHWLRAPKDLPDTHPAFTEKLARACFEEREEGQAAPVILLRGLPGSGRAAAVATAGATLSRPALCLNLALLPKDDDQEEAQEILMLTLREVRLRTACLVLKNVTDFATGQPTLFADLCQRLAHHAAPVVCLIEPHSAPVWMGDLPQLLLDLPVRSPEDSMALLRSQLPKNTKGLDLQGLVRRFQISPDTVRQTVQEAELYRCQRDPSAKLSQADLYAAFRLRAQQSFGKLAQRIEPVRDFDDLIISDELKQQLKEILAAIHHRDEVLAKGFARKIGYGFGISALFHGDSGTGKTMVAEVLAHELGVDLIKVDLSTVVNKYIGETEKNLSRIFDLATADAGVLFFDEADALFGKRSEAKEARDRHANIEVSYLLQRLENYPGLVVLATNNRSHLDSAFTRRLTFITRFTKPSVDLRERMWRQIWPEQIAVDQDIDFTALAKQTDITGASIRNIALLASWLAAEDKIPVGHAHIQLALQREHAKMGRIDL